MTHAENMTLIFTHICSLLKMNDISLAFMRRRGTKNPKRYIKAYVNLRRKRIVLDIYSPVTIEPIAIPSLIRTLCHEIAHLQCPPFRQRFKGHLIWRQHYPAFYAQLKANYEAIMTDVKILEIISVSKK